MTNTNNTPTSTPTTTTLPSHEAPTYSPYQCAKAVNEMFAASNIDKQLPPQMFYTYTKKGYIPSFTDAQGKQKVTHQSLADWFIKYCTKNNISL
jgi:hypothetical protein